MTEQATWWRAKRSLTKLVKNVVVKNGFSIRGFLPSFTICPTIGCFGKLWVWDLTPKKMQDLFDMVTPHLLLARQSRHRQGGGGVNDKGEEV